MYFDDQGWLDIAKEYNISGNSWDRGGVQPSHLVVHGTAGGSDGSGTLTYEASVGVSTHFALSTNGDIWQGVPCNLAAWGNAPLKVPLINFARADLNPNLWTVSIEFCKPDVTNQINITDAQKASGFALIAAICDQYHIPKRQGDGNGGIIRHADINSIDRAMCPGTFPFDDLWIYLKGENTDVLDISHASQYFIELTKDTRWHCKPTGYDIADGILKYYRTCTQVGLNGLSQYGLPVSGEQPHPTVKGVIFQVFERGVIIFDAVHADDSVPGISGPCYPGHLDRFLKNATTPTNITSAISTLQTTQVTAQALANALTKTIADLKG